MQDQAPCSTWNFPTDTWPGDAQSVRLRPTKDGVLINIDEGRSLTSTALHGCCGGRLRAVFRTLSAEVWPGVDLRRFSGNGGSGGLRLDLDPGRGALRLARWGRQGTTRAVQPIVPWTPTPLPPIATWTTLDVELQDNVVTAYIEGRLSLEVLLVHTWRGDFGVHISGPPLPVQDPAGQAAEVQRIDAWNIVEQPMSALDCFKVGRLTLPIPPRRAD
jgi:hypothetical protein